MTKHFNYVLWAKKNCPTFESLSKTLDYKHTRHRSIDDIVAYRRWLSSNTLRLEITRYSFDFIVDIFGADAPVREPGSHESKKCFLKRLAKQIYELASVRMSVDCKNCIEDGDEDLYSYSSQVLHLKY